MEQVADPRNRENLPALKKKGISFSYHGTSRFNEQRQAIAKLQRREG